MTSPIFKPVAGDLISLSPKLANSTPWKRSKGEFAAMHEKRRLNYPVMQQYIDGYDYQLKFVVDKSRDINEVRAVVAQLQHVDSSRVMLMAQGVKQAELNRKAKWIVESCRQYGFSYTPRLQIQLFGNRRGT